MTKHFGASYTIEPQNQNYIHAITTYNKHGQIIEIDHTQCLDFLSVQALPDILAAQQNNKALITIVVAMPDSSAIIGILPPFNPDDITALFDNSVLRANDITQYTAAALQFMHNRQDPNDTQQANVATRFNDLIVQEAFVMLVKIHEQQTIAGAIHFPTIQTVLFQTAQHPNHNYTLSYGQHAAIKKMPVFTLDIDDGFYKDDDDSDSNNAVIDELQKLFITWKANDYADSLIPKQASQFVCDPPQLVAQYYITEEYEVLTQLLSYHPKPYHNGIKLFATIQEARVFAQQRSDTALATARQVSNNSADNERGPRTIEQKVRSLPSYELLRLYNSHRRPGQGILLLGGLTPERREQCEEAVIKKMMNGLL